MRALSALQVIEYNKKICARYNITHEVLNPELVESAVGAAFFEISDIGYIHGEIPEVAAALCFKIIKNHAFRDANKRTAAVSSAAFLDLNGYRIIYEEYNVGTEFHEIIESVAINVITDGQLKEWFVQHTRNG